MAYYVFCLGNIYVQKISDLGGLNRLLHHCDGVSIISV